MQNNPEVIKKAKYHLRKYKIWHTVLYFLSIFSWLVISLFNLPFLLIFPLCIFIDLGYTFIFRKCIVSLLTHKLDAEAYLMTIRLKKYDTTSAAWQLYGEYSCGNYQNVVDICKMKMDSPKLQKRFQYMYLGYLANVYFELGDDEKLSEICNQFERLLANESPRKQSRLRTRFPRMTFYKFHLQQDMESCTNWVLTTPASVPILQCRRKYCMARISMMKGDEIKARKYYEELATENPTLNFGKLAIKALAEMDSNAVDCDPFKLSDERTNVTLYPANRKLIKTLRLVLAAILAIYLFAIYLPEYRQKQEYERELAEYQQSICDLVEQDHDCVSVLNTFNLEKGEDIIDAMFVCETDKDIIVGSVYKYKNESKLYYSARATIPIASLLEEDYFPQRHCFSAITSKYQIECYLFTDKSDIPSEYYHFSTLEVNGKKIHFVVTDIIPNSVLDA